MSLKDSCSTIGWTGSGKKNPSNPLGMNFYWHSYLLRVDVTLKSS